MVLFLAGHRQVDGKGQGTAAFDVYQRAIAYQAWRAKQLEM